MTTYYDLTADQQAKLHRGPDVDGRPTWFTVGINTPKGWEARYGEAAPWKDRGDTLAGTWYQVRPIQLDDPVTLAYGADHGVPPSRIVLWKEMRDRPDLDQWEVLGKDGTWYLISDRMPGFGLGLDASYPLRVRRRQPVEVEVPTEIRLRQEIHKAGLSSTAVDVVISVLQREGLLE